MSNIRDIDADYRAAYLEEYEAYKRGGHREAAERIAGILRDDFNHDVDAKTKRQTAKKASAPERADQKAPEQMVPEKPQSLNDSDGVKE